MKKIITITIWCCFALPTLLLSQSEASNWYFGNGAGITFNDDGSVTSKNDGQLNTFEGCATISDPDGQLLFYTDGIVVYNQDHEVMQNGNNLNGDPSSTQAAIIVPKPLDPDIFYIVTVDTKITETDVDTGLNYSTVDITQNNGRGAVIEKNINLLADCSEKLAAVVKDCSDESVWLITLATPDGSTGLFNTFHAFEINDIGFSTNSVKSTFNSIYIEDPRGYLKFSNDGTKMACANVKSGFFMYDFDAQTGVVSNQNEINLPGTSNFAYGLEFSPNSRFLYVHSSNDLQQSPDHFSSLFQLDLTAPDLSDSAILIDSRPIYRGALQLGDNGKIYRTIANSYFNGTPFLGVINNPDLKGVAANYQHNAISLGNNLATQGLPPFVQSFFNKIDLIVDEETDTKLSRIELCQGDGFKLEADYIPNATYHWTKDGEAFENPLNNIFEITNTVANDAGKYRLEVISSNALDCPLIGEAQILITEPIPFSSIELTTCDQDTDSEDGFTVFNLPEAVPNGNYTVSFFESIEDRTNGIQIENPNNYTNITSVSQKIYFKTESPAGCASFGEINLKVIPVVISQSAFRTVLGCDIDLTDETQLGSFDLNKLQTEAYPNQNISFYSSLEELMLQQNPLSNEFTTENTTLYIRIENENQCHSVEFLDLIVNPLPPLEYENNELVCTNGEPLFLSAPEGYNQYTWYNLDNNQIVEIATGIETSVTNGGTYRLEVSNQYGNIGNTIYCSTYTDFTIRESNQAIFQGIDITNNLENNSVVVMVSGEGDYDYSIDGQVYQDDPIFDNIDGGTYTVFVRDINGCGIAEKEIYVLGYSKFFSPNGDGKNDIWQVKGIDDNRDASITIFDRYGKLLAQFSTANSYWDGTFNGVNLPASDYWFKIAFNNGEEFNGHFALIR